MGWLLLIVLAGVVVVGGIAGFFGMFTKNDKNYHINKIENEIEALKKRLNALEKARIETAVMPLQAAPMLVVAGNEKVPDAANDDALPQPAKAKTNATEPTKTIVVQDVKDVVQDTKEVAPIVLQTNAPVVTAPPSAPVNKPTYVKPPPPPLAPPNFIEAGFADAKNWLFGGNTLVRAGIIILFIGVAFLLKFAIDHNVIPIEIRLAGVALLGAALVSIGWKLRHKRPEYAWALQGGGIGVMYLTIFAAFKLYSLIPNGMAFTLLIAIALFSAAIAVMQSAMSLAVLGFAGGFLAPIFTSTGHDNYVGLFTYYLILNIAIAGIALYKSWRPLNVLGFLFTFVIASLWGAMKYQPAFFNTTEPFLIAFFVLFNVIAVLYAMRKSTDSADYVDATLVFGTPIVGFSMQFALVNNMHFGLAYSALALGVFYIALAWWVLTRKRDQLQFLGECFLALGVGFTTLTLPLALDGRWTSAAWAVEGVGLLWVGLRQNRMLPAFAGLGLQIFAAIAFVFGWGLLGHLNGQNMFLGVAFIALSGWACGALINQYPNKYLNGFKPFLAIWGWVWWMGAGITAIDEFVSKTFTVHAGLLFATFTSVLLPAFARKINWPNLAKLSTLLLPIMIVIGILDCLYMLHPFARQGLATWLIAFASYIWLMQQQHLASKSAWLRAPILWLGAVLGAVEWQYWLKQWVNESETWHQIGWAVVPMLCLAGVIYWYKKFNTVDIKQTWLKFASAPIALFLVAWYFLVSQNASGDAAPLMYLPILNPLDISLLGVMLLLLIWKRALGTDNPQLEKITPILGGIMGFSFINGLLLRTLFHWAHTPLRWTAIFSNSTVQVAFTVLWAVTALILMLLAHKKSLRVLWIIGAALMGLVVAKLFLLDLAQHGSVQRIASFIGAGMMLLVMGYFAPLPPASQSKKEIL
jgi:uncharacterized membrane protein